MNANELADELENDYWDSRANKIMLESAKMLRQQQALIENLNGRIERMIENQSHHEGIAHAGGFEQGYEAGRKMGMKQERALWELAASTQEIEQHLTEADAPFQKPVPKELADKIDKALGIKR
jgi:hypothetical protein